MDPRPLVGEPLPLDLVNTRWSDDAGDHDLLDRPDGLAVWLRSNGLTRQVPNSPGTLSRLLEVREALLGLLRAGQRPSAPARRRLDDTLRLGRVRHHLGPAGAEHVVETDHPEDRGAWLAADGYLTLLEQRDRIRTCANPECPLWFFDVSKAGGRRWCSMAACGNRAKARGHYARQHPGSTPLR